ncbi:MAG: hypothetical protein A3H97_20220 [Acidobacteria bacterium RIFCSPLOWO2_02_FULL_65_29]|nr:MAG: hypothetical protein A3H97_20220 [Acidobacteria bacterium RIFCSPLOWO2_02_FULL_65_29]
MKITPLFRTSGYQTHLHMALKDAVAEYAKAWEAASRHPPLTEDTATPELTILHYTLEQRRAAALLLAAFSVEAVANLYLRFKAKTEQLSLLERASFIEKWTIVPSLFIPDYTFPKDGELYQDLKRLHARRNALAHLKEDVSVGGEASHPGSTPEYAGDEHVFVARCGTLPTRLVSHLGSFDKSGDLTSIWAFINLADVFSDASHSPTSATPDEPRK